MNIEDLRNNLERCSQLASLCEADTIERFIVPVLKLANWPIDSINPLYLKRGNRATRGNRTFDLELWRGDSPSPSFVFECKNLSCKISLLDRGALSNTTRLHSDYARQLRKDCVNTQFSCDPLSTIPVLTNGRVWMIFKSAFICPGQINENININSNNYNDFVKAKCSLSDSGFEENIISELDFSN